MVTKEQIDRINVLAKKKKTEGLTEAEQAELHASCEHIKGNIARLTWWDEERHPSLR